MFKKNRPYTINETGSINNDGAVSTVGSINATGSINTVGSINATGSANAPVSIDKELITDLSYREITVVMDWIRNNIRPSEVEYPRTSYGLKAMLERETGIYLTNNQMKDALHLAGYDPVDPNALNWSYRICFPREAVCNPSPFVAWLKEKHNGKDTRYGDFAGDVVADPDFPIFAEYRVIAEYLGSAPAWERDAEIFKELWPKYLADTGRKS